MTAPRTCDQANHPTPAAAGVLFTRTHDGLLVAKIRDNAFAMIDALGALQFLEMILGEDRLDYSVMQL